MSVEARLVQHLATWGLREFVHERDYDVWQRESLSSQVLHQLHELAEKRQGGADAASDQEFYDLASSSTVLPVVYSQRFGYYRAVGIALSHCLEPGKSVLDFGCGVGILTTWYASMFPDCVFTGVDRSPQSIAVARQHAEDLQLDNVSFQFCVVPEDNLSGMFDMIISTQALFQSETDPGLPSRSWKGFDRGDDPQRQTAYEIRTGIGERLDWLLARLNPLGCMLAFEKTRHLGRRVLFQRALAARGLCCKKDPVFLRYSSVDEHILDGPLYSLTMEATPFTFEEAPIIEPQNHVYRCQGRNADWVWSKFAEVGTLDQPVPVQFGAQEIQWQLCRTVAGLLCGRVFIPGVFTGVLVGMNDDDELLKKIVGELLHPSNPEKTFQEVLHGIWSTEEASEKSGAPLYENHSSSAQDIWQRLSGRVILREITRTNSDGQQYHVELGRCVSQLVYVYWANTLDQRQLVVMESEREAVLDEYFSGSGDDG